MLYFQHRSQSQWVPHMANDFRGAGHDRSELADACIPCVPTRSRPNWAPGKRAALIAVLAMSLTALSACSLGDLVSRPTATPPPTRTPAPTFTPPGDSVRVVTATPSGDGTPGVIVVPPGVDPRDLIPIPSTATGTATVTVTPTPTTSASEGTPLAADGGTDLLPGRETEQAQQSPLATPTHTATATATPTLAPTSTATQTPTPFARVGAGLVNLRTGPGIDYPLAAQLGPDVPVAIVGQNPEGTWFQICCVNGDSVWVAKNHVEAVNDTRNVVLVLSNEPPAPTATSTPTETPTITPTPTATPYPFQVSWGPLYFPTNNELLSIWTKVSGPGGEPLSGYHVKVQFRNREDGSTFEDRPNTKGEQPSSDRYDFNVPPGTASGNRVEYNYKYELNQ